MFIALINFRSLVLGLWIISRPETLAFFSLTELVLVYFWQICNDGASWIHREASKQRRANTDDSERDRRDVFTVCGGKTQRRLPNDVRNERLGRVSGTRNGRRFLGFIKYGCKCFCISSSKI